MDEYKEKANIIINKLKNNKSQYLKDLGIGNGGDCFFLVLKECHNIKDKTVQNIRDEIADYLLLNDNKYVNKDSNESYIFDNKDNFIKYIDELRNNAYADNLIISIVILLYKVNICIIMEEHKINSVTKKSISEFTVHYLSHESNDKIIYMYYESVLGGLTHFNFGSGHYKMIVNENTSNSHNYLSNNERINTHINLALEKIELYQKSLVNIKKELYHLEASKLKYNNLISKSIELLHSNKKTIKERNKIEDYININEQTEINITNKFKQIQEIEKKIILCNNILSFNFD